MFQTSIGDLGVVEVQSIELRQCFHMHEPGISDFSVIEIQLFQVGKIVLLIKWMKFCSF